MWSPIIWKQTTATKQFTYWPVLQMNICIFIINIYCFSFNIEPWSFNVINYLKKKKKNLQKLCFNSDIFFCLLWSRFLAQDENHFYLFCCQTKKLSTRTSKHFALQLWCKISVRTQAEVKGIIKWKCGYHFLNFVSFQTHMMFFCLWRAKGDVLKNVRAAHFHTVKAYKIVQVFWSRKKHTITQLVMK